MKTKSPNQFGRGFLLPSDKQHKADNSSFLKSCQTALLTTYLVVKLDCLTSTKRYCSMPTNLANLASDGRRARNKKLNSQQVNWLEVLQRQMDERPKPLFQLDERVKTPTGVRSITDMYHSPSSGWNYTFYTRGYTYKYNERELRSLALSKGELLLMQDMVNSIAPRG